MPVACQSCAPECPQAFGAEGDLPRIIPRGMPGARSLRARLRGLNVTVLATSPSFASQMPPPLRKGRQAAAAGEAPPDFAPLGQPPLGRGGLWATALIDSLQILFERF